LHAISCSVDGGCRNVPYEWINSVKANQNWLKKQGEKFIFPGGGTMFPNGVGEYIDRMELLIPGMKDGSVRTALDTGCGVSDCFCSSRVFLPSFFLFGNGSAGPR